jgi:hypothetical protein
MRVNDLVEDNEGDKAEVLDLLPGGYVVIEWDLGYKGVIHESLMSNLSERVRELDNAAA